jgi:membrane-bound lytic murein transglycosylase B
MLTRRSRKNPLASKTLRLALLGIALAASPLSGAYAQAPDAPEEYIARAAQATGWTQEEVYSILRQAELQPRILELMDKPAEKSMAWHEYQKRIVTDERVAAGKAFMRTYAEPLARAEATYGVPKQIIAGIIGLESRYGAIRGQYRVLDTLTTLSFHFPRRAAFFQKELTAFLVLAKSGTVDPLVLKGSYAGAIGWPQFMPSNVSKLATDFDGDGAIDLYNNPVDAIGSVAKYFNENGWKTGAPVVRPVSSAKYSNLELEGENGPLLFDAEHNFKVIKRYNRSNLYAMAVYELSRKLKAQ